jgi:uncharacterized protein YkuJ
LELKEKREREREREGNRVFFVGFSLLQKQSCHGSSESRVLVRDAIAGCRGSSRKQQLRGAGDEGAETELRSSEREGEGALSLREKEKEL